jgi:hypothetical protein
LVSFIFQKCKCALFVVLVGGGGERSQGRLDNIRCHFSLTLLLPFSLRQNSLGNPKAGAKEKFRL